MAKTVRVFADGFWEDRTFFIFERAPDDTKRETRAIPEKVVDAWERARNAHAEAEQEMRAWQATTRDDDHDSRRN